MSPLRSFERKLEDAQDSLGMEPRSYVPVTYVTELSWLSEALKLLPTLLLIGGYIYFQRRMQGGLGMGGGGGAGGARGIFNVGKAQVSKIDKNAKDKVGLAFVPMYLMRSSVLHTRVYVLTFHCPFAKVIPRGMVRDVSRSICSSANDRVPSSPVPSTLVDLRTFNTNLTFSLESM